SSPWMAASSHKRGPGRPSGKRRAPCSAVTGSESQPPVKRRATGRSRRTALPGGTTLSPIRRRSVGAGDGRGASGISVIAAPLLLLAADAALDEAHDGAGDVDAGGA